MKSSWNIPATHIYTKLFFGVFIPRDDIYLMQMGKYDRPLVKVTMRVNPDLKKLALEKC